MKMTKRVIGRAILGFLMVISAMSAFYFVDRAIVVESASKLIVPLISLSFFVLFLFLFVIVVKSLVIRVSVIGIAFLTAMFFTYSVWHLVFVIIALCLVLIGAFEVRRDLRASMSISIGRSVSVGILYVIIALSLVIASQYYTSIKELEREKLVLLLTHSSLLERTIDAMITRMIPSNEVDTPLLPQRDRGENDPAALPTLIAQQEGVDPEVARAIIASPQGQELVGALDGLPQGIGDRVITNPHIQQEITEMYNLPPGFMERYGEEILAGATLREMMPKVIMMQVEESILKRNEYVWNNIAKVLALILFLSVFTIGFIWRFFLIPLISLTFFGVIGCGIISRKKELREVEVLQ